MTSIGKWFWAGILVLLPACSSSAPSSTAAPGPAESPAAPPDVRLHALDCGRADIKNMKLFGDEGGPRELVAACYVIRHPQGTLLWDTGVSDKFAEIQGGFADAESGIRLIVRTTLADNLRALGITPADVQYVAFSHLHVDHAGNANLFTSSTWILNRRELEWATRTPAPAGYDPALYSAHPAVKTRLLDGDTDVFGDGKVKIIATPGHTPGHQTLIVQLRRAGTIVISGDIAHTHDNWEHRRMPVFNTDPAETLRSMERIRALVGATKARFVVQHEPGDLAALPPFPAYLD
jgi:glyoxylase-like metal-dependent hydrolase (beta-lactamase superfamily II)